MSEFAKATNVFVNQSKNSREDLLSLIAEKAVELGVATNAEMLYDDFVAREELGETGMTDGFAVPHAKSSAVTEASVIVVKNDHPVSWPSFDDKPVDIAIALLVPSGEAGTTHIKLLSKTAVLLMKDDFKNLLRGSDDPQAIADAINAGIED
ncbi:PTS sugar transporter subunit IIA [Thermophilibacter mediterraneus]|uniref:PTS sugar transporter subunit IIA n=1 Tax=Thermophilibacter mediterraneus TaxID=1871031 RepID=UPI0009312BF6|nr:fructose PTS transporter subunit IIA [Thermophilibacter mediterraneus]